MTLLDKKNYIVKQLYRTHNKKYENYVITRIWHLLNDLDIKIITQQYIVRHNDLIMPDGKVRKKGYALADLYFPQFSLIVEVDEEHHLGQKLEDEKRKSDIVNSVNFQIENIDTTKDIEEIHKKVSQLVGLIIRLKERDENMAVFKKWDYESEFDNQQYIDKGYIDVEDNAIFRKSIDACNCFGLNLTFFMRGGVHHPLKDNVHIWFPKLYKHKEWNNQISLDENTIYEKNIYPEKNKEEITKRLNSSRNIRYAFVHSKDNIGRTLYRFKGEYTLNREKTIELQKAVWERTNTRVETIRGSR